MQISCLYVSREFGGEPLPFEANTRKRAYKLRMSDRNTGVFARKTYVSEQKPEIRIRGVRPLRNRLEVDEM